MKLIKQKRAWIAAAIAALFVTIPAWASTAPYVKPQSLWPFHSFEILMMVLGFFAAYRAVRSHLPSGDRPAEKAKPDSRPDSPLTPADITEITVERTQIKKNKANNQLITALRIAGLTFMVGGSALAFNTGGIDYGPAHFDEFTTQIFGGALFLVGLSDFFLLPKLLGGTDRK